MKLIMTAIASLGAMTTFVGSAFADVSFTIRFGSRPSVTNYRTYDSHRSNVYQPTYQDPYYRYNHRQNNRSRVIVRERVPNYNYGNSWNYPHGSVNVPSVNYPVNHPTTNQFIYNPYNSNLGDRYIVKKRYIRIR